MLRLLLRVLPALVLAVAGPALGAEPTARARYTLAEALAPQNIRKLVPQLSVEPNWIGKGHDFWYVRETADGRDYLRVDGMTGASRPLFDHERLAADLAAAGAAATARDLSLREAELDEAGGALSFGVGKARYRLDLATGKLTPTDAPARDRSLSPDGRWRVSVRDWDLYLTDTRTGESRRLTDDGAPDQPYARPVVNLKVMVAKGSDRPALEPDVAWSPDSRRFATYRLDLRRGRKLGLVQSTPPGGAPPKLFVYDYPLTGDAETPLARPMVFEAGTGRRVDLKTPPEPILYYYGPEFTWSKKTGEVLLQRTSRGYQAIDIDSFDPQTGVGRTVAQERDPRFIDAYTFDWSYVDPRDAVILLSERSGWAHLWLADGKGGVRALTRGDWRVHKLEHASGETGRVLFSAGGGEGSPDPYLRRLYRTDLKGAAPRLLTPEPLDHAVSVSPDGTVFVDNMSRVDEPTRSVLRSARDGRILAELGRADVSRLLALGFRMPERFHTTAADGKTPIFGVLYRPAGFSAESAPTASLPVIDNIYTGPHYVMAPTSFAAALTGRNAVSVAQIGAAVINVDGRGTNKRSRAFTAQAYQNLGEVGLDDHVKAIRDLAERYPYLDAGRVGVYGFSAGGYDVVRAMTRRPDVYKVGVSASGNHDNRLDKATWNELWMGPTLGPVYDANSNVTHAGALAGKLLLAHGEMDENVPPAATFRLVDALIAANKDFDLLVVPGADHYLDDVPYFNRKRLDFFTRHLVGAEPPDGYAFAPFEKTR